MVLSFSMANRRPIRRLPFGGFRRRRQVRRWTANLVDQAQVVAGVQGQVIVVDVTDYASNINIEPQGPTLARVRGFVTIAPILPFTIWMGLYVVDRDSPGGSYDPSLIQNVIDEEPLWWYSYAVNTVGATTPAAPVSIEIDVKAKRRLKDSDLILTWNTTSAAGTCAEVTASLRALLLGTSIT